MDSALRQQLQGMITGYWISQMIHVAATLELADRLAAGPRSVPDLARATESHAPTLYRLLRALASLGLFAETDDGCFRLTPLAELLRSDVPGSQHAMAVMSGGEHYRSWGELLYSVCTGSCAFEHLFGTGVFDHLARNPEAARNFDAAMVSVHSRETEAMLSAYDFSDVGTLVDVGGGNGSLLIEVIERYPSIDAAVFDLPHVVQRTAAALESAGLGDRLRVIAGSFFDAVPPRADAYLMRHIIHDWDDQRSRQILANCRRAMRPDSRLLLVEMIIPPGNSPFLGKLLDLNMLVVPGGLERTEQEYRELLASAGLRLVRVVPTESEVSVIECLPV